MIRPRTAALAGALALSATAAAAADLLPPPPIAHQVSAPLVEVASGLYLRGDVGVGSLENGRWRQSDVDRESYVPRDRLNGVSDGTVFRPEGRFLKNTLDDQAFVGIGAGYRFSNWFRADVTGEYRTATAISGLDRYTDPGYFCPFGSAGPCATAPTTRNNIWSGSLSSTVALVNGYVDLGTWNGLTPYVGAGVGGAYNRLRNVRDFDPGGRGGAGTAEDKGKWGLAYAFHAGLGYAVNDRLSLDLGYRYLNLGDAESGPLRCLGPAADNGCGGTAATGNPLKIKKIESHDIKLGMRWMLQAPEAVAYAQPYNQPLVRKY